MDATIPGPALRSFLLHVGGTVSRIMRSRAFSHGGDTSKEDLQASVE